MRDYTLSIGIPTAGRPDAIQQCLAWIGRAVEYPHETVILDNTPDLNAHVSYQEVTTVLYPDKQISPGESRARIASTTDSDLLLFLDDDTFPRPGSIKKLITAIDEGYKMASGVWTANGSLEEGRELGRIFNWGFRGGERTLVDIPVAPDPIRQRGFRSWDADVGLPTLLIRTDLLDSAVFDPRYDWFYEWLDFFLQTHRQGEQVHVCLDAPFEHAAIPYSSPTIKSEQERAQDRQRLLDKWEIDYSRGASLGSTSWKQSRSLDRRAARIYADGGITELAKRTKRKVMNL